MYFRLSIYGAIGAGENWSVNPCFDPNAESPSFTWDQASGQAAVNAIAALTVPALLVSSLSNSATIVGYRLEGRSDDHRLLGVAEATRSTPVTGQGAPTFPSTSSVVLSLRTSTPGGRGRGRLYWPLLSASVQAQTFRLPATYTQNMATAASSYLTLIQNAIRDNAGVFPFTSINTCVVSRASGERPHITRIMVGDVVDTQRRRRDRLAEAYASAAFPAS